MTSSSGKIFAAKTPVSGWVVAFPLQEGRVGIRCLLSIEKTAPPSGQPLQVGGLNFIVGSRSQGNWYQGVLASE